MSQSTRILLGLLCTTLLSAATASAALAAPQGPGWELSATNYPTNLVKAIDEIQTVTATEESGTFSLTYAGAETHPIPVHATAAEVQSELQALSTIGAENVTVSATSPGHYSVHFINGLGNMRVAELEAGGAASTAVATPGAASGTIGIDVFNIGAAASHGPITLTDRLPPGVKAKEAGRLLNPGREGLNLGTAPRIEAGVWDCTGNGTGPPPGVAGASVVTCTNDPSGLSTFQGGGGTPTFNPNEDNNPQPAVGISVEVQAGAPEGTRAGGEANHVAIAGGGAQQSAGTSDAVTISSTPAAGGLTQADAWFSNADGTVARQAGSHPYTATFIFGVATANDPEKEGEAYLPGSEIRDLETRVPPGLIGDLHNVAQCTRRQLFNQECPPASMVGRLKVSALTLSIEEQVFNLAPAPGAPAELGFNYADVPVYINFSVHTGGDYSVVARVNDIPQRAAYQSILTLWGTPQEASHNRWRNREGGCSQQEIEEPQLTEPKVINYCAEPQGTIIAPFLRLPTSCGEPEPGKTPSVLFRELNGWQDPNARSEIGLAVHDSSGTPAAFTGCEELGTEPTVVATPETSRADSPTGLTVDVKPPLGGLEEPNDLSPADIQDATVTLPEGLVINPGQAAGLQACGAAEDALTTDSERTTGRENDNPAACPPASKIGTVTIKSPLIEADPEKQLEGSIYVLQSNPPEVKLLVAASADGVNIKLVGVAHLNEQTGRVETKFQGTPQLPFSDFKLSFEGGAKAALDTPTQCGDYTANADFTPWSSPFASDFLTNASFAITEGPGGSPCPNGPLPFAPTLTAGTTGTEAGAFTSFSMHLQRGDGQQRIEKLQFKSPAGLSAMTSSVPLCGEAEANAGTCPAASHIGHAIVAAGPGVDPLTLPQPGAPELPIYLTGPYHGAPFGLSIVTPVIAGPFNLGTIVTRAKIEVDPTTAQITVMTDPLPQIVKGVPTDIRSIDAIIDRPGFFFNPTNCTPQQFSGSVTSAGGAATAPISSPFGVGACQALKFTPKLTASTSAHTSKANGASLHVKITYPAGAEADISKVNLTIPAILPTRLTTLQQACTEREFNANPAACPPGSLIATATVHTPVLKSPLMGPAYFVSHGGAAFPDVEMILQGEGVTLIVDGKTQIKKGVTYSRFETVPDEPFSSFEFNAPQGPHSILTTNGNLCAGEVKMPTTLTAQNGAVLTQSTPVTVEGCPNGLRVLSHKIRKRTLTLKVSVPAAGRLTASAKGLTRGSKSSKGRSTLTLTLKAKNRHGKLKTKVKLSFVPAKGHRLSAAIAARFGS